MEIQGGMLSQRNIGGGHHQQQGRHNIFGMPRDRTQDVSGGPQDSHPPYNLKFDSMSQLENNFAPGAGNMSSSLQRQMMEQFNTPGGLSSVGRDMMPHPPPTAPSDTIGKDEQFDMEVETFLACLGKEIKKNHRMNGSVGGGAGAGAALPSPSNGTGERASFASSYGGNFGATAQGMGMVAGMEMGGGMGSFPASPAVMAEGAFVASGNSGGGVIQGRGIGAATGMGFAAAASASGFPSNQTMVGMHMGTSAETMVDMMKWGGQGDGGSISTSTNQPNPEMLAMAKMMMGGGNSSTSANEPNSEMTTMANMMMIRNSGGGGGNSNSNNFGMMPRPPFDGNDFREHQQRQGVMPDNIGGDDDDNPVLPEHGWGQGSNLT